MIVKRNRKSEDFFYLQDFFNLKPKKKWELAAEEQLYYEELRCGTWKRDKFAANNGLQHVWGAPLYTYKWGGDAYYKWAIPQSEREKNPSLQKNEGWM